MVVFILGSLCGNNMPAEVIHGRFYDTGHLYQLPCLEVLYRHLISKTLLFALRLKSHFFCYPLDVSIYLIFWKRQKQETPYICRDTNQVSVWEGLGLPRGVDYKGHKRIFYGDENPVS